MSAESRSFRASINPLVLKWARDTLQLSQESAAKKIGVSLETLKQWEDGEKRPTIGQLRSIANVYKRSTAIFYLQETPKSVGRAVTDFRFEVPLEHPNLPSELILEMRRTEVRRQIALDLAEELDLDLPSFPLMADLTEDPEIVATRCRYTLGISINRQLGWKDSYEALKTWRDSIEAIGVLVFHAQRLPANQMRGFSLSEPTLPVIVLNSADGAKARIFTMMHELGHLCLRVAGICDPWSYPLMESTTNRVEVFCNQFAGSLLVPSEDLLADSIVGEIRRSKAFPTATLQALSSNYKVSRPVILRRLLSTGVISRRDFERENQLLQVDIQRYSKPESGPVRQSVAAIWRNGLSLTKLVLTAHNLGLISVGEISNYLRVKTKHIPEIAKSVGVPF